MNIAYNNEQLNVFSILRKIRTQTVLWEQAEAKISSKSKTISVVPLVRQIQRRTRTLQVRWTRFWTHGPIRLPVIVIGRHITSSRQNYCLLLYLKISVVVFLELSGHITPQSRNCKNWGTRSLTAAVRRTIAIRRLLAARCTLGHPIPPRRCLPRWCRANPVRVAFLTRWPMALSINKPLILASQKVRHFSSFRERKCV